MNQNNKRILFDIERRSNNQPSNWIDDYYLFYKF